MAKGRPEEVLVFCGSQGEIRRSLEVFLKCIDVL